MKHLEGARGNDFPTLNCVPNEFPGAKSIAMISFAAPSTREANSAASGTRGVRGIRRLGCFFVIRMSTDFIRFHAIESKAVGFFALDSIKLKRPEGRAPGIQLGAS
jgi:hypothetical protein